MRAHQVHDLEEILPCGSLRAVKEEREDIAIGRGIPVASRTDAHEACTVGCRGERGDGLDTRSLLLLIADPIGIVACLREHEGQCGVLVPLLLRALEGVEANTLRNGTRRPSCRRDSIGEEDEVARPDKRILLRGILQWIAVTVHIVAAHGFAEDKDHGDTLHITCMLDSAHIEVTCICAVLSQQLRIGDTARRTDIDTLDGRHIEVAHRGELRRTHDKARDRQRHEHPTEEETTA